jgi:hypothetical protein
MFLSPLLFTTEPPKADFPACESGLYDGLYPYRAELAKLSYKILNFIKNGKWGSQAFQQIRS